MLYFVVPQALEITLFIEKIDSKYKILRAAAEAIVEHHSDKADKYETASRLLKEASFYSVGISDSKGNAVLSNGEKSNISDRKYFKDNMAGRSAMNRVDGTLVDRKNIFIISVPIIKKSIISGSLFKESMMRIISPPCLYSKHTRQTATLLYVPTREKSLSSTIKVLSGARNPKTMPAKTTSLNF